MVSVGSGESPWAVEGLFTNPPLSVHPTLLRGSPRLGNAPWSQAALSLCCDLQPSVACLNFQVMSQGLLLGPGMVHLAWGIAQPGLLPLV